MSQEEKPFAERIRSLASQIEIDPMLREALTWSISLTSSRRGYIGVYREGQPEPRWCDFYDLSNEYDLQLKRETQFLISTSVVRESLDLRQPYHVGNPMDPPDKFEKNKSVRASGEGGLLCVPIPLYGEWWGVLYLQRSMGSFTQREINLAASLARLLKPFLEPLISQLTPRPNLDNIKARFGEEKWEKVQSKLVGEGPAFVELLEQIWLVSEFDAGVLLTGPSGTGKSKIAELIHELSPRCSDKTNFVTINCAALSSSLLESELFGHEANAFTGAKRQHIGKLEMAQGGTAFFDEVGDIPLESQVKLLRALQERKIERVGGNEPIKLDIRVIAATNRDLEEEIKRGRFREDLYYRLSVIPIRVPALKERKEDIPRLLDYFCEQIGKRTKADPKTPDQKIPVWPKPLRVSERAKKAALLEDWPGNVRELEHALEAGFLRATKYNTSEILPEHLLPQDPAKRPQKTLRSELLVAQAERSLAEEALSECGEDIRKAASCLGDDSRRMHKLMLRCVWEQEGGKISVLKLHQKTKLSRDYINDLLEELEKANEIKRQPKKNVE